MRRRHGRHPDDGHRLGYLRGPSLGRLDRHEGVGSERPAGRQHLLLRPDGEQRHRREASFISGRSSRGGGAAGMDRHTGPRRSLGPGYRHGREPVLHLLLRRSRHRASHVRH